MNKNKYEDIKRNMAAMRRGQYGMKQTFKIPALLKRTFKNYIVMS